MGRWLYSLGIWLRNKAFWWLIGLGVLILGLTERPFFYDLHPHWQLFIKEVAFAFIIASIFGLTVDRYQREEFVNLVNQERGDLKRDIFAYAYGHTLHDQIRNEISVRILNCPFHREDLILEWEFSADNARPDYVIVEKRQRYILKNNTHQAQTYPYAFTQITASEKESLVVNEFLHLKLRRENEEKVTTWTSKDMTHTPVPDDPHVRTITTKFELKPLESVEIFYAVKESRRIYADDSYAPRIPQVGKTSVSVRVNEPLCLDVSAACRAKALETRAEHQPPRRYCWELDEGLLPHQAIAFSWSPRKENKVAATDDDPKAAAKEES
jgi:hypothetical protein